MSKSSTVVADDMVVTLHFRLSLDDREVVVDTEADGEPMSYLHGHGEVVHGLESALRGRAVGDSFDVVISPEDGYGEHDPEDTDEVPRDAFPDDLELEVGLQLSAEDEDGNVVPCVVREVHEEHVVVDMNHPLAGETLHYTVKILEIRPATAEELEHGHVHDADDEHGHHH